MRACGKEVTFLREKSNIFFPKRNDTKDEQNKAYCFEKENTSEMFQLKILKHAFFENALSIKIP